MPIKKEMEWEKINKCLLCGCRKISTYLKNVTYWENNYKFIFSKCSKCDFVFLNPRPKKKYISTFYKSNSYWGQDLRLSESLKQDREKSFKEIYSLIDNDSESIFDIGAGTGLFLSKFKELKWKNINGIEYSKDAVKYAKKAYGVNLFVGDFLEAKIDNIKYDYIVLNNVLEHLYKPQETLKKVEKMLDKDGKVIVAIPNINSIGYKIFKKNWYPLQPPIHLTQFSSDTIMLALDNAGFRVISINHVNKAHAKYSLFESYRSFITKRNVNKDQVIVVSKDLSILSSSQMHLRILKKFAVMLGLVFSNVVSYVGFITKRGENIIVYAEKK